MNETFRNNDTLKTNLKWPDESMVTVGNDIDYVFIFRKDIAYTTAPIAEKMSADYSISPEDTQRVLSEEYDIFFSRLVDAMYWAHSPLGNVEIDLFDPKDIEDKIKNKAEGSNIVSLDPLITQDVHSLQTSRMYYFGGKVLIDRIARPGSLPISQQINALAANFTQKDTTIVDDDLFKGGSITMAINEFQNEGRLVNKVVPGIKLGDLPETSAANVTLDPVVRYRVESDEPVLSKVNLADPRDYLYGGSGLVVQLPGGDVGRVPYFEPFISTSDKTGIPPENNREFALRILKANFEFFSRIENTLGYPVSLKHMNSDFIKTMNIVYGFNIHTNMTDIVTWTINNIDELSIYTNEISTVEQLKNLKMQKKLVFLDVNGTLIKEGENEGVVDEESLVDVKKQIAQLQEDGFGVGLCSDSSVQKLQNFSTQLGMEGPIIAENGNVIYFQGKSITVNKLSNMDDLKEEIRGVLSDSPYNETADNSPLTFSGFHVAHPNSEWTFGANRTASISVYGPPDAINALSDNFASASNLTEDHSASAGFFSIQTGNNKETKGKALKLVRAAANRVVMIGNSNSDWVDPSTGVECGFVGNATISTNVKDSCAYISSRTDAPGVIEILYKINEGIPGRVSIQKAFADGEVNKTYLVDIEGTQAILQLASTDSNAELAHLSQYFHADKLKKVVALLPILTQKGIPVPSIVNFEGNEPISWITMQEASGVQLSNLFLELSQDQKKQVVKNMAVVLAKIHSIDAYSNVEVANVIGFEGNQTEVVFEILDFLSRQGVIDKKLNGQVREWYINQARKVPTGGVQGLVHRDFIKKNVFIDPNTLQVSDVIDWGDTSQFGDVVKDTVLSAMWIAGDISEEEGMNMFTTFLEEYNQNSDNKIDLSIISDLLDIYSMQWFLEAALYTHAKGDVLQVDKQIKRILSIINSYGLQSRR